MSALAKARTYWRLGPANLARAALYRALLRAGHYRRRMPLGEPLRGPFFVFPEDSEAPHRPAITDAAAWTAKAQRVLGGELPVFSNGWREAGFPPRWQRSLITQVDEPSRALHWSMLPDFALAGGDVKGYWESSRFDGLLILALGWLCSGRIDLREGIARWLEDWCAQNPANTGLQWKCGQETGLRLMHTLLAADLLARWGGVKPAPALTDFVCQHAERIAPTMLYAVAQDNNHGTSEAAALYVAGLFLARHGDAAAGRRYAALGRRWLEERIGRLVMPDGSFSQHSTNYHRLMLDTCALAETARPTVTALRDVTGESAQLWLPDGEWRVCLLSVEATHELRTIVDEGSRVAIDVGSGGRALQGEAGTAGWVATVGERADGVGSVSAGVLGPSGSVVAAVGISGPIDRLGDDPGARFGGDVVAAANELSEALGVPPRHG